MKLFTLLAGLILATAVFSALHAGGEGDADREKEIVISIVTDDFAIEDQNLSHLGIGDAETFVTESGKTVDMLRTEEGIEIYVDGELIDMEAAHEAHHVTHTVTVICDDDTECEELEWISEDGDGDWDVEVLSGHPVEAHGTVHIVREISDIEPGDLDDDLHGEHDREVIIIKKKIEDEI